MTHHRFLLVIFVITIVGSVVAGYILKDAEPLIIVNPRLLIKPGGKLFAVIHDAVVEVSLPNGTQYVFIP